MYKEKAGLIAGFFVFTNCPDLRYMNTSHTEIETERLLLRPPAQGDAEEMFEQYARQSEVTHFLGWPRHTDVGQTRDFIEFSQQKWEQDQIGPYLILDKLENQIIGSTGLELEENQVAATGYVLARKCWGNGYATEALHAMVELATQLDIKAIYALCHPENSSSIRVLEKCGFELEAELNKAIEFPNLMPGMKSTALKYLLVLNNND